MDSLPITSTSIDKEVMIQSNSAPFTRSSIRAGHWMQLLTQKEGGKWHQKSQWAEITSSSCEYVRDQ